METNVKNLLAVSWCMPPLLFPRSVQVSRTLKSLSIYGWDSTILCSDPRESENINTLNMDTSLAEFYGSSYRAVQVPTDRYQPLDALSSQWLKSALNVAKEQISTGKYAALLTFAQPWVDHLVGLEVRKFSRIPWLAHFSDPWVDSPYYSAVGKQQLDGWRKLERSIIQNADAILFTNPQAAELVMRKYPAEWKSKSHVIPHAYDEDLAHPVKPTRTGKRLRLVYTGDFYGVRSPLWFLQALNTLSQTMPLQNVLEVHFVGRIHPEFQKASSNLGLDDIVFFQEQQPYFESLKIASLADVLLLIDAPNKDPNPFLPSKLVDYLMLKKPILGLTPRVGASADLLNLLECPVVDPDDVSAIAAALVDLIHQWQAGTLSVSSAYLEHASAYGIHEVGRLTDSILSEVIASYSKPSWWQRLFRHT